MADKIFTRPPVALVAPNINPDRNPNINNRNHLVGQLTFDGVDMDNDDIDVDISNVSKVC